MKSDVKEVMIMQSLTEVLFEEAFQAQEKYDRFCALYGVQSDMSMRPLHQYEILHDVIERAGLITTYIMYYRTRKKEGRKIFE